MALKTQTLRMDQLSADPGSLADGEFWYNDTLGLFRLRENGVTKSFQPVVSATAPSSPTAGDLWYNTSSGWNELLSYDSSRSKWLSSGFVVGFGSDNADGNLLSGYGISVPATGTGLLIPRTATITRIDARAQGGNATKAFDVLKNGSSVLSFSLASSVYKNNTANIDLAEDDYVWVSADSAGVAATDVVVLVWISWRAS